MAFISSDDTVNIVDLVGPMMLDCPYPIASQGILWSAMEFCQRTLLYANVQTLTVSSTNDVTLSPADDAVISDILNVFWNDCEIYPIHRDKAAHWLIYETTGVPKAYFRPTPQTIRLVPPPAAQGTLKVTMALTPMRNGTTLPSFLYDSYWDCIEHGALYKLMSLPNRSWSNPAMAAFHKAEFEKLIGVYAAVAIKDGTRLHLRSKANFTVGRQNWRGSKDMNYWRG